MSDCFYYKAYLYLSTHKPLYVHEGFGEVLYVNMNIHKSIGDTVQTTILRHFLGQMTSQ